jgi:hypothetical protein
LVVSTSSINVSVTYGSLVTPFKGRDMFSSIRRYTVGRGSVEELTRRVEDGFVPLVRRMKGFKGYYLIKGGSNVLIAMSVFETAEQALVSNEMAADWVRKNVLDAKTGPPEVIVGDVLISEIQ